MAPRTPSSKSTKPSDHKASDGASAAKKETPTVKKAADAASASGQAAPAKKAATVAGHGPNGLAASTQPAAPPVKGEKDGISWTKDFDYKFLAAQRELLLHEREQLVGQASRLEDEANSLIEEHEMGDVQFDEESGEGDTMAVERERDLALSSQARQMVADIDAALDRIAAGTYGYSVVSGAPIPRDRLEAIPWATELVEEKVGGLGRR